MFPDLNSHFAVSLHVLLTPSKDSLGAGVLLVHRHEYLILLVLREKSQLSGLLTISGRQTAQHSL